MFSLEPVFVNLLRAPELYSQPNGPVISKRGDGYLFWTYVSEIYALGPSSNTSFFVLSSYGWVGKSNCSRIHRSCTEVKASFKAGFDSYTPFIPAGSVNSATDFGVSFFPKKFWHIWYPICKKLNLKPQRQ
jgi:hypothetical protein